MELASSAWRLAPTSMQSKYFAVKVLSRTGVGQFSWVIAAIDWCVNKTGKKILHMAIGSDNAPKALESMCNLAWRKGLILVSAVGSNGGEAVTCPARYGSVIAVSGIDDANTIPAFSNRGPEVELCAPAVNVLSTIPGGTYAVRSGTSMACSFVSGAAALAWGSHRFSDNVTIRRALAVNADNLGAPGRNELFGYGRVDAENSACSVFEPGAVPGMP